MNKSEASKAPSPPTTDHAIGLYNLILQRDSKKAGFLLGKTRLHQKAPSRYNVSGKRSIKYGEYEEGVRKMIKGNRNI